jgi:hypothetical protein
MNFGNIQRINEIKRGKSVHGLNPAGGLGPSKLVAHLNRYAIAQPSGHCSQVGRSRGASCAH